MTHKHVIIPIAIVVIGGIAWYLGSPLFLNTTVNEEFPQASSGLTNDEQAMIDTMESLTPEQVEAMPEGERMEARKNMEELGQKMPDERMDEPMQDKTQSVVVSGTFRDADSFHRGSGTAVIYELSDGRRIVRFENFTVTNGPALSVYLVKSTSGDVAAGYVNLGKLKGNMGNQNYEIPADVDLKEYGSIVIWCVPFGVTFSVASLQ